MEGRQCCHSRRLMMQDASRQSIENCGDPKAAKGEGVKGGLRGVQNSHVILQPWPITSAAKMGNAEPVMKESGLVQLGKDPVDRISPTPQVCQCAQLSSVQPVCAERLGCVMSSRQSSARRACATAICTCRSPQTSHLTAQGLSSSGKPRYVALCSSSLGELG